MRVGLGYVKGVRVEEMEALVAERERGGPYRGVADLASRSAVSRDGLERLAWAGALDGSGMSQFPSTGGEKCDIPRGGGRRGRLWEVGTAATGRRSARGTQLALPLDGAEAPELEPLGAWERVVADYAMTGMTLDEHPLALLRERLGREVLRSVDLATVDDGATVAVAGMLVARQRPETAKGIVFMLIEDESGTVNLIVPPPVYERCRAAVRAAPLVRARGRLERREGAVNVIATAVEELRAAELAAVAPAGHSFGRRA